MMTTTLSQYEKAPEQHVTGVDACAYYLGFTPAFRDLTTHETHLSVTAEGDIACVHIIENLPIEWVTEWDNLGYPKALKETVIAGFIRAGQFFTFHDMKQFRCDA